MVAQLKEGRISGFLLNEQTRLRQKGLWTLGSLALWYFLFSWVPDLLSLIWPTLLASISQIPLFIGTLVLINGVVIAGYNLAMIPIYRGKYAFFERFRISQEVWPWETDYKAWRQLLKKTIANIMFNSLVVGPVLLILDCSNSFRVEMSMEDLPASKWTYVWQFTFYLVVNEVWTYTWHALMHHPKLYWIHKPHHQYAVPVSLAGMYVHPLQYIILSSISTGLGYKLLLNFHPVHMYSLVIWLIFRLVDINECHTGYNFPWSMSALLPMSVGDNYHYFHHRVNAGNYSGILYFMDSLFGTNAEFWRYQGRLTEAVKRGNSVEYGKKV